MSATTHEHGGQDHGHGRRRRRIAGPHLRFRRLLPPDPQLLLLGTALLRHPGLLVDALDLRHPRRHRHHDRRLPEPAAGPGPARRADAADAGADAAEHRHDEVDEDDDADACISTQGGMQDQMAAMQENSDGHGRCVQRRHERRHLLPAAGDLRQRRLQARHGQLHLPRRPRGAVHHLPRGRSADRRRHRPHRRASSRPRRKPSRAPRWRAPGSTSVAPRRPSRTCRKATTTTC